MAGGLDAGELVEGAVELAGEVGLVAGDGEAKRGIGDSGELDGAGDAGVAMGDFRGDGVAAAGATPAQGGPEGGTVDVVAATGGLDDVLDLLGGNAVVVPGAIEAEEALDVDAELGRGGGEDGAGELRVLGEWVGSLEGSELGIDGAQLGIVVVDGAAGDNAMEEDAAGAGLLVEGGLGGLSGQGTNGGVLVAEDAAPAPLEADELLDEKLLDGALGLVLVVEGIRELLKLILVFFASAGGDEGLAGHDAAIEGIERAGSRQWGMGSRGCGRERRGGVGFGPSCCVYGVTVGGREFGGQRVGGTGT